MKQTPIDNCYVIRILRRDKKDPNMLAGIIEGVESEVKKGFKTLDELISILRDSVAKDRHYRP